MAYSTVANVNSLVQAYLNDSEVDVWTASVLLPFVNTAYQNIARRLLTQGYTLFRRQALPITLGPTATTIARSITTIATTANGVAVDFTGSGLDDATFGGTWAGTAPATYEVEITSAGTPDVFKWRKTVNGGTPGSYTTGVNITGAAQTLSTGVTVTFGATTGHTAGNSWLLTVAYYPSDMIRPAEVREIATAASAGTYNTITAKNEGQLPNAAAGSLRQIWDWKYDVLYLRPGTVSSNILLLYEPELPTLSGDSSEILIFNGLQPVALVTAGYCARSWAPEAAAQFLADGFMAADALTAAEQRNDIKLGQAVQWGEPTSGE